MSVHEELNILANQLKQAKREREWQQGEVERAESLKFGPVIDPLELDVRNRPPRDFHDDTWAGDSPYPYSLRSEHSQAMDEQDYERRR